MSKLNIKYCIIETNDISDSKYETSIEFEMVVVLLLILQLEIMKK